MQSQHSSRRLIHRQDGVALLITLMVLMLCSVLMVGFFAAVVADTRASGLDRDQTQAYAASHAGLEQITSDLSNLFVTDFSPTGGQIATLRANPPSLSGFSFIAPGGAAGSGYWVQPRFVDASGNPRPEDPVNGSQITSGPYQGFRGIITPYDITVTARACAGGGACPNGAEVRMRRTLQTVAIPVFQFGMFSETDLAFHAGAEAFSFGGRVHTNGNLFLAAANGGSLTIADRITAVNDVIRTHLPNGLPSATGYTGTVRIPTTIAQNPVNNIYRNLLANEGSITGTVPPTQVPTAPDNPNWVKISQGTYLNNIRNGDTGAKRLDLPLVADLDSNGVPDAEPIELIRRPALNSNEHNGTQAQRNVYAQRFYALASLRILLSDADTDLTGLPLATVGAPVSLAAGSVYAPGAGVGLLPPLAASAGPAGAGPPANTYRSVAGTSLINGFLKIEMQRNNGTTPTNGTWQDVTAEILGLGIAGKNLADANEAAATGWNNLPDSTAAAENCQEPNPNAVIRLQRVRDVPAFAATGRCGFTGVWPAVATVNLTATDYWPNALYDTREGEFRDGLANNPIYIGGVMHYVELDVNNLRRWLAGQIGANGTQAKNDNGFIIYFSDRRNNNDALGNETAEYGFEDVVNLTNAAGTPNQPTRDEGEDVNGNNALDIYGQNPVNIPAGANVAPFDATSRPWVVMDGTVLANALAGRANRPLHFRRALKLVNGALGQLPQGLTIVSENPVYVQGNYNSDGDFAETTNVPASVIADAVTLLSNSWNDIRSFSSPANSLNRIATTTSYRMAVVTGKTKFFPQPAGTDASFGSDGGAHNFVRSLEEWNNPTTVRHRYRGSMVSFFVSRQAVGTFKCCDQDAYNRGTRDWSFDTDFLSPARLPPGTPMFRDVNTLTFRQLLRPTQ